MNFLLSRLDFCIGKENTLGSKIPEPHLHKWVSASISVVETSILTVVASICCRPNVTCCYCGVMCTKTETFEHFVTG